MEGNKVPKLRIRYPFGHSRQDVCTLEEIEHRFRDRDEVLIGPARPEQARYRFTYGEDVLVIVEGQLVRSYEELSQLVSEAVYQDREFLEVELLLTSVVGG